MRTDHDVIKPHRLEGAGETGEPGFVHPLPVCNERWICVQEQGQKKNKREKKRRNDLTTIPRNSTSQRKHKGKNSFTKIPRARSNFNYNYA